MNPYTHVLAGCLTAALLIIPGCGNATASAPTPETQEQNTLSPQWQALAVRLTESGLYGPDVETALLALGESPSQDPMGRKITELYKRAFLPRPKPAPNAPKTPPQKVYKGVVTEETLAKCRAFMAQNRQALNQARQRYGVPPEVATALLFVETRLGTVIGKENAFLTLASMAATRDPAQISGYLAELPRTDENIDWVAEKMKQRSDWAYKELTAFIRYARAAGTDPLTVPGSIYGAIGLCQFMPSNLEPYGADGNNDAIVDLFVPADAIASLGNYLFQNGWKGYYSREKKLQALKRYNNSFVYANTILVLAEKMAQPPSSAKSATKPATGSERGKPVKPAGGQS